jgi:enoyl-CoA hydratase/carnithine racemase
VKHDMNRHLPPFDMVMFGRSLRSPEVEEGFKAFVEKRPPQWPRS